MGVKYSRDETVKEIGSKLGNIASLYKEKCINWSGKTKDKKPGFYSEIIADELIKSGIKDLLQEIKPISRNNYKVDRHTGKIPKITIREEEIFAKDLFNYCKAGNDPGEIGVIIDYQVPLKANQNDDAGKIDLISFSKDDGVIYLLELKGKNSKETLLRCILEISTYYRLLDKENFIKSYSIPRTTSIKKSILICHDSQQHDEIKKIQSGQRLKMKDLFDVLEVRIFLINHKNFQINSVSL